MFINLINIKTYFICPSHNDKYIEREKHMKLLLNNLGFTNIIHYKSGNQSYPLCLLYAIINILNENLNNEPILILEDDVDYTNESLSFDIPDNTDAMYLGISKAAGDYFDNINTGNAICKSINNNQVKIINMLSGHAIMYISKKYKKAITKEFNKYINIVYHTDVIMSRIQQYYNIIANKKPLFYQSNNYNIPNDMEEGTKFIIDNDYLLDNTYIKKFNLNYKKIKNIYLLKNNKKFKIKIKLKLNKYFIKYYKNMYLNYTIKKTNKKIKIKIKENIILKFKNNI